MISWPLQIAEITRGKPLYILRGSDIGNLDGLSFHIATARNEVLQVRDFSDTSAFYLADKKQLLNREYESYMTFTNFYAVDSLRIVKFK